MPRLLPLLLAALTCLGIVLPSPPLLAASLAQASAVPSGRAQLAHASPLQYRPLTQAPASTALEGTGEATQSGAETRGGTPNNVEGELTHVFNERGEIHRLHYDTAGRLIGEDTFDDRHLRYRNDPCARPVRIIDERRFATDLEYD